MVQPYSSTETVTAWKISGFILAERSDFHLIDKLLIAVHTFPLSKLISISVDEILPFNTRYYIFNINNNPYQMNSSISWILWHINHCWLFNTKSSIGLEGRVFANGPGDLGSIPCRVLPKTLKMVLDTSLFNTQQYKVRIKGKVEQSRERSSVLPLHFNVVAIEKGAFWSSSTTVDNFTFYIIIYI